MLEAKINCCHLAARLPVPGLNGALRPTANELGVVDKSIQIFIYRLDARVNNITDRISIGNESSRTAAR